MYWRNIISYVKDSIIEQRAVERVDSCERGMDRMRCLSETELEKLLAYVQEKADIARRRGTTRAVIDQVLVLLLVNAGLRISELCNLTIADLVTEQGASVLRVRDTSGNVSRAVEITAELAACLRKFVELRRSNTKPNDLLLVNERGTRLAYISIFSKIKRIGRQAGLGNLHPRVLGSTYVARLYESTQDLLFVQQQAGHASPRTTAMYAMAAKDRNSPIAPPDEPYPQTAAKSSEPAGECEACGKQIRAGNGTRIDSGQILCLECLNDLRGT
jgi:site-specific recombinase XerD